MVGPAEKEYRKYVAVLREDSRKYAPAQTRRPKGRVNIEVGGRDGILHCLVKNLAQAPGEGYTLWLVKEDSNQVAPLMIGLVTVDEKGNGQRDWQFEYRQKGGTGVCLEAFDLVELRAGANRGARSGDRVLVGELELTEVNLSEDPALEQAAPFGTGVEPHQWWKFYPGHGRPGWAGLLRGPRGAAPGNPEPCIGPPPDQFERSDLPHSGPAFQGHQLIGLEYDEEGQVKYLIHGIPGRFCFRDQPYGGETGYVFWKPLPGQSYRAGDYGYWLVYLVPRTGEVAFPNKEITPPDCENCDRQED